MWQELSAVHGVLEGWESQARVAYAWGAYLTGPATGLAPVPVAELQLASGPALAPAPGVPSWLVGAQQIAPNLFYVSSGTNNGFYKVHHFLDMFKA